MKALVKRTAEPGLWLADVPNAGGLATGESIEVELAVTGGAPLELTLVWTDPPAAPEGVR